MCIEGVNAMETTQDLLLFFAGHMEAWPLYEAFRQGLDNRFPQVNMRVQKTQVTFFNRHVFACVSFQRVKRKRELPEGYLVITLGMPFALASSRVR